MGYTKPKLLYYRTAQVASWLVAKVVFRRKILRNEIKGKHGPFVVIANHQAALDFVNLIGVTSRPMSFVISKSFFETLPIKGFLQKMGMIPKQQFQTTVNDLKRIKAVIDAGEAVVIYPAGLMCEDGLSTPIPEATYKFLKWLGADVYVARTQGTYFAMPKWGKGFRPGRTLIDIYQLFSKEELAAIKLPEIQQRTEAALLFDAYREQEELMIPYQNGEDISGLENVLYMCPHCGREFTMQRREKSTICCGQCGFEQVADRYGFLHNHKGIGPEVRYVSDWSRLILERQKRQIQQHSDTELSAAVKIRMIDPGKKKFVDAGWGTVSLSVEGFRLTGSIRNKAIFLSVPIGNTPTLPFAPGKHFEIQDGGIIYRCVPEDGRMVMKLINTLKAIHEYHRGLRSRIGTKTAT